MKTSLLRLLSCLVLCFGSLHAADDKLVAALRAADDERVAATTAGDRARLAAIFSDELHYAHSSGKIDTKASLIEGIITSPVRYGRIDYQERTFKPLAPGIALMRGRAFFHMVPKGAGETTINDINFLAVWREEHGKWRFLAWQACKIAPAAPPATK